MLKFEYECINYIRAQPSCRWIDIINAFAPQSDYSSIHQLLECMLQDGLIRIKPSDKPPLCLIKLPPKAFRELAKYEQQRREAEEERKQRKNELLLNAVVSLMSAIVGATISLVSVLIAA